MGYYTFPTIFRLLFVKLLIQLSDLRQMTSYRAIKNEAIVFSPLDHLLASLSCAVARKWRHMPMDIAALEEHLVIENFKTIEWRFNFMNVPDNELPLPFRDFLRHLTKYLLHMALCNF